MMITLQVVGIFFQAELSLAADTQVRDVLFAAQRAAKAGSIPGVSAFDFRDDGKALIAARAIYTSPVTGRGIGGEYPAGEYYMAQNTSAVPAYTVWQYYVLDASGKSISRGVRFLDDPSAIVPVGGKLIWRLVSILKQPVTAPRSVVSSLVG